MSLYIKHRPDNFEDVKGNEDVVEAMIKLLANRETTPHAIFIHGPTGCGKTTLGRIFAKELGAVGQDYREIDSAEMRGIDTVRAMRESARFSPVEGECRVFLIDECHKMTNDAQNAMLKGLEDCPDHVYYILCTTAPDKMIKEIRGRCIQFGVKTLTETQMIALLRKVCRKEGETVEKEVLEKIATESLGHSRNALNILEHILCLEPDKRMAAIEKAASEENKVIDLCRVLFRKSGWKEVSTILADIEKIDPEEIRRMVLGYCGNTLKKGDVNRDSGNKAAAVIEAFWEPFYNQGFTGVVYACYSVINGK